MIDTIKKTGHHTAHAWRLSLVSRKLHLVGGILFAVIITFGIVVANNNGLSALFHKGQTREYWIAVVPTSWNIVPNGVDGVTGLTFAPQDTTTTALIYKQYTPHWQSAMPDEYGGQPGPTLYGEVGDTLLVHFKNMDTHYKQPHSMHPHGVTYSPDNDGSYIYNNQSPGGAVPVGGDFTYRWTVSADSVGDWVYHDHSVNAMNNTALGMYGLLELVKPGTPRLQHRQVVFFNEMTSEATGLPNEFDTINGKSYVGNAPNYSAKSGDTVSWTVAALGSDFHVFHIHGHRWEYDGRNQDGLELGPAEAKTVTFKEDSPGTWLVHCHVDEHMMNGMTAEYKVADTTGKVPAASASDVLLPAANPIPQPAVHMHGDDD